MCKKYVSSASCHKPLNSSQRYNKQCSTHSLPSCSSGGAFLIGVAQILGKGFVMYQFLFISSLFFWEVLVDERRNPEDMTRLKDGQMWPNIEVL